MLKEPGLQFSRMHPDDIKRIQAARAAMLEDKKPINLEYRFQHADGRWLWMHTRAAFSAREPDGTGCIDGMTSDITAQKALEEQLRQSQKVEVIGELTAGIAHNFANVLTVITANAEALVESLPSGDTREVAEDVRAAARRGVELTSRLLAFTRKRAEMPQNINLNDVISDVKHMVSRTITSGIEISITPGSKLGSIYADRHHVEQVLVNLIVNARDAGMPKGGNARASARSTPTSPTKTERAAHAPDPDAGSPSP